MQLFNYYFRQFQKHKLYIKNCSKGKIVNINSLTICHKFIDINIIYILFTEYTNTNWIQE